MARKMTFQEAMNEEYERGFKDGQLGLPTIGSWAWACEQMRKGFRVKRPCFDIDNWAKYVVVGSHIYSNKNVVIKLLVDGGRRYDFKDFVVNLDDLEATDWEVIEGE